MGEDSCGRRCIWRICKVWSGIGKSCFLSYRDPNLSKTLDIYDSVALYLKTAKMTDEDILQTIIGCIGDLDRPMTADQKGYASMVQFLREESLEDRQRYRQEVLNTSIKDFREFAEKLHVAQLEGSHGIFARIITIIILCYILL